MTPHSVSKTYCDELNCEKKQYMTVAKNDAGKSEIHIRKGNNGYCSLSWASLASAWGTIALKYGAPVSELAEVAMGIRCQKGGKTFKDTKSCMDAIGKHLKDEAELTRPI